MAGGRSKWSTTRARTSSRSSEAANARGESNETGDAGERDIKPIELFFARKPSTLFRLAAAVVLSIILMSVDHRVHHLESVRGLLSTMLYPLHLAIHLPIRMGDWLSKRLSTRQTMLQENARMREELIRARSRLKRLTELEAKNRRLRDLLISSSKLNSPPGTARYALVAELISVDKNPLSRRLVLNVGNRAGVLPGQTVVIDADGVMGQVTHAGPFTSSALLITDPSHALPVRIHRNGLRAVALGAGPLNLLKLSHVPNSADVQVGDKIVTSGLGDRFPGGYPVGEVVKVLRDPSRPFAEIHVQPSAMLERTREVILVRSDEGGGDAPDGSASEAHTSWSGW